MRLVIAALFVLVGFGAVVGASAGVMAQHLETVVVPGDPFGGACEPAVTQPYGPTDLVGEPIVGGVRFHTGIDLACPAGVPVHSVTAGLTHVATGWNDGYGDNVVIELVTQSPGDPAPRPYFVRYSHLDTRDLIPDGILVGAGQPIGRVGTTGFTTGPHLHFEVDRGQADASHSIDPTPFVALA